MTSSFRYRQPTLLNSQRQLNNARSQTDSSRVALRQAAERCQSARRTLFGILQSQAAWLRQDIDRAADLERQVEREQLRIGLQLLQVPAA